MEGFLKEKEDFCVAPFKILLIDPSLVAFKKDVFCLQEFVDTHKDVHFSLLSYRCYSLLIDYQFRFSNIQSICLFFDYDDIYVLDSGEIDKILAQMKSEIGISNLKIELRNTWSSLIGKEYPFQGLTRLSLDVDDKYLQCSVLNVLLSTLNLVELQLNNNGDVRNWQNRGCRMLYLSMEPNIHVANIKRILSYPSLLKLKVSTSGTQNVQSFCELLRRFPNLNELTYLNNDPRSIDAFEWLSELSLTLPHLKKLKFFLAKNTTIDFDFPYFEHLKCLSLEYFTSKTIGSLGTSCKNLRKLYIPRFFNSYPRNVKFFQLYTCELEKLPAILSFPLERLSIKLALFSFEDIDVEWFKSNYSLLQLDLKVTANTSNHDKSSQNKEIVIQCLKRNRNQRDYVLTICLVMLCIKSFRNYSLLVLPKDMIFLITTFVWKSRHDSRWTTLKKRD